MPCSGVLSNGGCAAYSLPGFSREGDDPGGSLWPCAGRDEFVKRDWLGFLSGLEAQFLKHKTGELAGIKLLITTLLNFPAAQQGP